MKKQIRELKPGEKFRDSIGCVLSILEVGPERSSGIPRTKPKIRLHFVTELGHKMFCDYSADRRVEVLK